jgi:eukaryotic-like serine/threonine-protein kinase
VRRLTGDLDTIVLKALQKDPARRYGTVEQFAQDITRHLDGRPVLARPDTYRYRTTKFITRHKAGVAAAALVVVSLVGGIIATAWQARVAGQQRSRAERRFNDVRRLANSFLFEFHDAIANLPGATKARELVVKRAIEYLDSLSKESASDASLERELAAAYEKVGDVQGLPAFANLGDTPGALQSHRTALMLRRALADANPSDPGLQRELSTTYSHLGMLLEHTKDYRDSLDHERKALDIREALLAANPRGVSERAAVASSYQNIGQTMVGLGDWGAAFDNFQRLANTFETLLAEDPTNRRAQRDASVAFKKLGAIVERNGDRTAALANYRKAVALDEARSRADANDAPAHLDLSYGYASIGYTLSRMGDIAGSLDNYQRALSEREQVARADPHDANAQDTIARAHLSIGQVLRTAGRQLEAIPHFLKALEIASVRYAADPANGATGERLANVYGALAGANAGLASAAKDKVEAIRRWREARAWARKSLDIWVLKRTSGALSALGRDELKSLEDLIAKCEVELAGRAVAQGK